MVELKTVIEEFRSGKIDFDYKSDDCCTTPGELLILLGRLAELEERIDKGEVIEAPCNKGDTVYWVDALNKICPIKAKEFTLGVRDEKGYCYSHFGSSIYLSEEEAKHCVELNRMRACEECYKDYAHYNAQPKCGTCSKIAFKEKYAEKWRAEEQERVEKEDCEHCKRCFISRLSNGREDKLVQDCSSCSGKRFADKHGAEWKAENMKEAE